MKDGKQKNIVFKKLYNFFDQFSIELRNNTFVLCVSGGRDSMCLYDVFMTLKSIGAIESYRVVHFNHAFRDESLLEARELQKIFTRDQVSYEIVDLTVPKENNFEMNAREARYNYLDNCLKENELCCFGHHLNDHFEWSLMRMFRSGDDDYAKGMPRVRLPYVRPLSFVSRDEITEYVEKYNITYFEDYSNGDDFADRNYIRNQLTPLIAKRFPNYLNFYLSRQNINDHLAQENSLKIVSDSLIYRVLFSKNKLSPSSITQIKEQIKLMSNSERGSLTREVEKLIRAFNSGKKGPMLFSGNVYCWLDSPFMIFYKMPLCVSLGPIIISSLSSVGNRSIFVAKLLAQAEFLPFVCFSDKNHHKKDLVPKKLPKPFSEYAAKNNFFSLSDIYHALPE